MLRALLSCGGTFKLVTMALCVMSLLGVSEVASAQEAGTHSLSVGVVRYQPNDRSTNLVITNPPSGAVADTGFSISREDTFGLTYEYMVTDNVGAAFAIGVPPAHTLTGTGILAPAGINPLATIKNWALPVLVKYHFSRWDSGFRPFVGGGVNYSWFTDETVTPQFQQALSLLLSSGATALAPTTAKFGSKFSPVVSAGFTYPVSKAWGIVAELAYVPLKVTAKLQTDFGAGGVVASEGQLTVNPLVIHFGVRHTF